MTTHLDDAACAIAHRGIFVRIAPGPAKGGELRLSVRSGLRTLTVIPVQATPALFDVFDLEAEEAIGERLSLLAMVELVCNEFALDRMKRPNHRERLANGPENT